MFRSGTYWACVAQIAVNMTSGVFKVEKITVAVDPGIVINPAQLKRQVEGGAVMGVSIALLEEVRFDESGVTSSDWRSYPIATMADLPEIKVVLIHNPERGHIWSRFRGGQCTGRTRYCERSFDATGKTARRLPLKPDYVKSLLNA